jgi:murein L,D-transpeptidase YafK
MTVYRDGKELAVFDNIAFGAAGVKEKQRVGDDVTPRGTYTVGWIRKESKFVHFIGLNYPSLADAERGYRNGVIGRATFERIKQAIERGKTPPQDTPLGGQIGIHGVGRGSLEIHRLANWTAGCIAIEDHQIRRLARIVSVGMRVEIR